MGIMIYRITLVLPCGSRHVVASLSEAALMISLGWRLLAVRGRSMPCCPMPYELTEEVWLRGQDLNL